MRVMSKTVRLKRMTRREAAPIYFGKLRATSSLLEIDEGREVDEKVQLLGNGANEEVGREVEGLEVGAVGEEWGDGVVEGEVGERELVDAAIVAGGALEVKDEAAAGVGEGGFGPILEGFCWVFEGFAQVG
ncbi:hypothetical protein ACFX1S_022543 [Malus domestica]